MSRNPIHRIRDRRSGEGHSRPLPAQTPDPAPRGTHAVQLLRTYPYRGRVAPYPFAPRGERSIAHGYAKVIRRARALVYLEDQYLWSVEVVSAFADALRREPSLRLIAIIPRYPDQDGRFSLPPNLVGRVEAIDRACPTSCVTDVA